MKATMRAITMATVSGSYLVYFYLFLKISYLGITTGAYSTTLRTNDFGEHWAETIMLFLGLPGLYFIFKSIRKS